MIDINCDLGEGSGNDDQIMPFISSCSIACGGHIGDRDSILEALTLAKGNGVKVGAHPSYPDTEHFGRAMQDMPLPDLLESINSQIGLFLSCCKKLHMTCHHLKLHGALYNEASTDAPLAQHVVNLFKKLLPEAKVYAPWQSELEAVANRAGMSVWREAFADRNYHEDYTLVSRADFNANVAVEHLDEHLHRLLEEGCVKTVSGVEIPMVVDTLCIHGDGVYALEIARKISRMISISK